VSSLHPPPCLAGGFSAGTLSENSCLAALLRPLRDKRKISTDVGGRDEDSWVSGHARDASRAFRRGVFDGETEGRGSVRAFNSNFAHLGTSLRNRDRKVFRDQGGLDCVSSCVRSVREIRHFVLIPRFRTRLVCRSGIKSPGDSTWRKVNVQPREEIRG